MVEITLPIPPCDPTTTLESLFEVLHMTVHTRGTLSKYPGSVHWHLKRSGRSGTLEVTWWPMRDRLWAAYHDNRIGDGWVVTTIQELAASLEGQKT